MPLNNDHNFSYIRGKFEYLACERESMCVCERERQKGQLVRGLHCLRKRLGNLLKGRTGFRAQLLWV